MPASTSQVLRRLARKRAPESAQEATSRAKETTKAKEAEKRFHARLCASMGALAKLYPSGLIPEKGIPPAVFEAQERMNAAARAGDFEEAEGALGEWEEAWKNAFNVSKVFQGRKGNV